MRLFHERNRHKGKVGWISIFLRTIFGRLGKAKNWLHSMGMALFEEKGTTPYCESDFQVRLFDATKVKESGKTGSLWRIQYSLMNFLLKFDYKKPVSGISEFTKSVQKSGCSISSR